MYTWTLYETLEETPQHSVARLSVTRQTPDTSRSIQTPRPINAIHCSESMIVGPAPEVLPSTPPPGDQQSSAGFSARLIPPTPGRLQTSQKKSKSAFWLARLRDTGSGVCVADVAVFVADVTGAALAVVTAALH